MKVYIEHLNHFNCTKCSKWWSIADFKYEVGDIVRCPHCGYPNMITEFEESIVENKNLKAGAN